MVFDISTGVMKDVISHQSHRAWKLFTYLEDLVISPAFSCIV